MGTVWSVGDGKILKLVNAPLPRIIEAPSPCMAEASGDGGKRLGVGSDIWTRVVTKNQASTS